MCRCSSKHWGEKALTYMIICPREWNQAWPSQHHRIHFQTAINQNSKTALRQNLYKAFHQHHTWHPTHLLVSFYSACTQGHSVVAQGALPTTAALKPQIWQDLWCSCKCWCYQGGELVLYCLFMLFMFTVWACTHTMYPPHSFPQTSARIMAQYFCALMMTVILLY